MDAADILRGTISTGTLQGERETQEDRLCAIPIRDAHNERQGWLLAILDGHRDDSISSYAARRINDLATGLHGQPMHEKETARKTLRAIIRALTDECAKHDAGSTISLTFISETGRHATIAYLGDSPIVILDRAGGISRSEPHNARLNTRDRHHAQERGGYYEDGKIWWNNKGLEITRALGDADFDHMLIRNPGSYTVELGEGSIVLLASDGIITCGERGQKKFFRTLMQELSLNPSMQAHHLTHRAHENGSRDNITAILWRT